jgi:YesN/AraC family two-component response regulator
MQRISVLIVDDDVAARDLLSSLLRTEFDVQIETLTDGIDAMRRCREADFDIVWMDFEMPGMDGLDAISVIKSVKPDQFIAMVSGHSSVDVVKKAISLGVDSYLVKPFTLGKVKGIVDKFLQSSK